MGRAQGVPLQGPKCGCMGDPPSDPQLGHKKIPAPGGEAENETATWKGLPWMPTRV